MSGSRNTSLAIVFVMMVVLAVLGVACWMLLARSQLGPYRAIAMSESSLAYGGALRYADPAAAYECFIAECNKASGANDCVVKASLKGGCEALAISVGHNASFLVQDRHQLGATSAATAQRQASGATDCAIPENICSSVS